MGNSEFTPPPTQVIKTFTGENRFKMQRMLDALVGEPELTWSGRKFNLKDTHSCEDALILTYAVQRKDSEATLTLPKPRKHQYAIIQWADGHTIQHKIGDTWFDIEYPSWSDNYEHRVKPSRSGL